MKTNELIALLAQQNPRAGTTASFPRFAWAILAGLLAAGLLIVPTLGIRADLSDALRLPMFWWKLAYALCLGAVALTVTLRLSTPGREVGTAWFGLLVPPVVAVSAAVAALWLAPGASRVGLVLGATWRQCPFLIALLSIPAFAAVMWAIRGFAPTRLRLAGACGGLLAGTLATAAYCLHCPEMQLPFWATWYTAGMLIPALAGVVLGPRLLRW